jgi:FkbM family methyltransferase
MSPEPISHATAPVSTVTLGGHVFNIAPRNADRAAFWREAEGGGWEDSTLRFVRNSTDADTTFIDIGAWIGPVSLVAGARAKRVIAIEPDPVAVAELKELVALNSAPIEVWHAGIDGAAGSLKLFAKTGFGDTMTSALGDPTAQSIDVAAVSFADISAALAQPAEKVVVKMDVEGHEYAVAEQLVAFVRRHKALLHLSLHPAILCRAKRRTMGSLAARWQTFLATRALLESLASCGEVHLSKTGRPITVASLLAFVFVRRRPKNFSVDVIPVETGAY